MWEGEVGSKEQRVAGKPEKRECGSKRKAIRKAARDGEVWYETPKIP